MPPTWRLRRLRCPNYLHAYTKTLPAVVPPLTVVAALRPLARKKQATNVACFFKKTGNVLLSQAAARQVSSALGSLTAVFEMGTGVPSPLLSPDFFFLCFFSEDTLNTEQRLSYLHSPWNHWSSARPISTGQLRMLPCFHLRPINVVVSHGSYL